MDEVRAGVEGKSRAQARQMLLDALSRHGVDRPRPLGVEFQLDQLRKPREDHFRRGVKLVKSVAGLSIKATKAIRDRELPDSTPPDWLEPPSHALYAIPHSGRWTAAQLEPLARSYLDDVYQAAPRVFGIANLTAWVRPADHTAGGTIEVALGDTPVGRIATADAPLYQSVLAEAATRDEHPCLEATLSLHQGEYLLEIASPPEAA